MRGSRTLALATFLATACASSPDPDLFRALGSHDNETARRLVEAGADLGARDEGGVTPLMFAVFSNNHDGARILLEQGADPDVRAATPERPSAIFFADADMIDLLVRHGADLELRTAQGQTPLWWNAALGNVGCVRRLLAAGADADARDDQGTTPLEAALLNRDRRMAEQIAEVVELLRKAGAR
jgi:ankyrin repeat protein